MELEDWLEGQLNHPIEELGKAPRTNYFKAADCGGTYVVQGTEPVSDGKDPDSGSIATTSGSVSPGLPGTSAQRKQDRKFIKGSLVKDDNWAVIKNGLHNPEGFIWSIVQKHKEPWIYLGDGKSYFGNEKDDYMAQGKMALVDAAQTYDSDKAAFSTWAYYHVNGKILDMIDKEAKSYKAIKLFLGIPEDMKERLVKQEKRMQLKYKENHRDDDFEGEGDLDRKEKMENTTKQNPFKFLSNDYRKEYKQYPEGFFYFLNSLERLRKEMGKVRHKIWINSRLGKSSEKISEMDGIDVAPRTVRRYKSEADEKMSKYLGVGL